MNYSKNIVIIYLVFSYSDDIKQDYPILMNGKYAYVINDKRSKKISYKLQNLQFLEWN